MNYEKILVILPHPDDEVFPMSGTLSQYIKEGSKVTYACMTLGEMGRNLGNPPFANRVTLPMVREKELKCSCNVIGINELILMGYHDKTVEFEPYEPLDKRLLELIQKYEPQLIMTYYPGHGVHPDHNSCGEAVIRTVGKMNKDDRPEVHCVAFPMEDMRKPDLVLDISPNLDKKIAALKCHSTQFRIPDTDNLESKETREFLERISTERFWIYDFEEN